MTCATCHRPITRGTSAGVNAQRRRCLVCRTAETMRGWNFPASQDRQRELRTKKATKR